MLAVKNSMKRRYCREGSAKSREAKGHGMRVMRNVTESFGEDAHHDRKQA
jgi:hypothetical protein